MFDVPEFMTFVCGIALVVIEISERIKTNYLLKQIEKLKLDKATAILSFNETKRKYDDSKTIIHNQKKEIETMIMTNNEKEVLYLKALSYWYDKFNSKSIILNDHAKKLIDETKVIKECPICLEPMDLKSSVITTCGHQFHKSCYNKWIEQNKLHSCPVCRKT